VLTIDAPERDVSDLLMGTSFVDVVKKERARRRWSQAKLAEEAGVSPASIYRLESGESPEDGDVAVKVRHALGMGDGHSLPASPSTAQENGATLPSAMGQLIGRVQYPAGVEDHYQTLLKVALEEKDAPTVFKELAEARSEAPPGAGFGWWMRRYLAAKKRATSP